MVTHPYWKGPDRAGKRAALMRVVVVMSTCSVLFLVRVALLTWLFVSLALGRGNNFMNPVVWMVRNKTRQAVGWRHPPHEHSSHSHAPLRRCLPGGYPFLLQGLRCCTSCGAPIAQAPTAQLVPRQRPCCHRTWLLDSEAPLTEPCLIVGTHTCTKCTQIHTGIRQTQTTVSWQVPLCIVVLPARVAKPQLARASSL